MSDIENADANAPKGVSRRTVTKAMAWAVPAVAAAAAAPAYASSGKILICSAGACKAPGQGANCSDWDKGYVLGFKVTNTHTHSITITFSNLQVTSDLAGSTWTLYNSVVTVAANSTAVVPIGLNNNLNSQQASGSGTVDACWVSDVPGDTDHGCFTAVPFSFATTNPCVQYFKTNCPTKGQGAPGTSGVPCA